MEDQQQKKYQLMTETPVSRLIPRMALPCVVSMLVTAFYNMAGTEKFSGSFDFTVTKVLSGRFPGTLLVLGTQKMEEIRLK